MSEGATIFFFLVCTFAMFTLPFVTFFAVRDILEKEFGVVGFPATAWAVLAAVIVVNVIILIYVRRAYSEAVQEEAEEREQVIEDKKSD